MNFIPKAGLSALFNNNSNEQPKDQDCSSQELSFIKDETVDNDRILIQEIEREAKRKLLPRLLSCVLVYLRLFNVYLVLFIKSYLKMTTVNIQKFCTQYLQF